MRSSNIIASLYSLSVSHRSHNTQLSRRNSAFCVLANLGKFSAARETFYPCALYSVLYHHNSYNIRS